MVMGYCARCKDMVESSRFRKAKSVDGVGQKVCAKYVCLLWGGIRDPQREQKRAKVVRRPQATDAAAAGGDANVDVPPARPACWAPRVLVGTDDVAAGGDASVDLPPARPGPRLLAVDRSNGERSKADRDALEALAERLDGIKGVLINGKTKELYIDAAKWTAEECSFPLTMPETAGHTDDMHAKWTTAKKKAPALHKAIVNCLNGAALRCIEHLQATRVTNPKSVVTFGTPSFLLYGDGGMPHLDAVHEWQCLMALHPCAPSSDSMRRLATFLYTAMGVRSGSTCARLRRTLSGSSFLSPSGKQEQLSDVCRLWRDWRSTANAKEKSIE